MIVLWILQRITQKVLWNCSKLFIKVCFCSNNKPISGVMEEAGFYSLFPVLLCDWGYWDYSASQCIRLPRDLNVCFLQSRSFSSLLILGNACSTPNRRVSFWDWRGGWKCRCIVSFLFGAKDSSLFIRLLLSFAHKTRRGEKGSNKKIDNMWTPAAWKYD